MKIVYKLKRNYPNKRVSKLFADLNENAKKRKRKTKYFMQNYSLTSMSP